jgi:glucose/arabinose dehydrogenase
MRLVGAVALFAVAASTLAAELVNQPSLTLSPYLSATNPTGIRFTGPNEGFLIEKGGLVKRFAGGTTSTLLDLDVATDNGERGLLGIAFDAANNFVFLYHTAGTPGGTWIENRLTRYTWNGTALTTPTPLATFGTAADSQSNGPNHNGGPLLFRDGKLFGVTGDLNRSGIEQNASPTTSAFTGGVFRLNSDGSIPADNPFASNSNPDVRRWYAYGVRNSFGIAVDPHPTLGGKLWITENGPGVFDEVNLVPAGMNSGWNRIMGPDRLDPQNAPGDLVMLPGTPNANYQDPKFSIADSDGIAAMGFLYALPGYEDVLIYSGVNTPHLWLLRLNPSRDGFVLSGDLADGVLDPGDAATLFGTNFGIVTDIQTGPDGAIYLTSLNGHAVYRIAPIPEPHTWVLSLAGLALVGWAARRRRRMHG